MKLVDINAIKNAIADYEKKIENLKNLMKAAESVQSNAVARKKSIVSKSKSKPTASKSKSIAGKKSASEGIRRLLKNNKEGLSSGTIKDKLIKENIIKKDNVTIYSLIQQLVRKGDISKSGKNYILSESENRK